MDMEIFTKGYNCNTCYYQRTDLCGICKIDAYKYYADLKREMNMIDYIDKRVVVDLSNLPKKYMEKYAILFYKYVWNINQDGVRIIVVDDITLGKKVVEIKDMSYDIRYNRNKKTGDIKELSDIKIINEDKTLVFDFLNFNRQRRLDSVLKALLDYTKSFIYHRHITKRTDKELCLTFVN